MLDEPVAREPGCVACRKRALLHRWKRGCDAGRDRSEYFGEAASKSKEALFCYAPDFEAHRIEPSGEQKIAKRNAFPELRSADESDRVVGRAGEALV